MSNFKNNVNSSGYRILQAALATKLDGNKESNETAITENSYSNFNDQGGIEEFFDPQMDFDIINMDIEILQNDIIIDTVQNDVKIVVDSTVHEEAVVSGIAGEIKLDFDETNNSISETEEIKVNKNQGKKRIKENKALQNKLKKQRGETHLSKNRKIIGKKSLQPNPCKENCQNGCRNNFADSDRLKIFKDYWALDEPGKRNFVLSCMEMTEKKRTYKDEKKFGQSRRGTTGIYFLPSNNGRVRVCLQFLLKTLDVSHRLFSYTYKHKSDLGIAQSDKRGRKVPPNKTPEDSISCVKKFVDSLPTVPSHYCRRDSSKTYLSSDLRSKANLYRLYKNDFCLRENIKAVSEKTFLGIFRDYYCHIGIHIPKKDKCAICEGSKEADKGTESYALHIREKNLSISMFKAHQIRSKKDPTFLCASFDLQKVLNTPHGDNMLLYYSRKYAMYNFTVYESGTRNGYCFLWGECDGKRGANEICSNLFYCLTSLENKNPQLKTISLFCDSCPGQNKNKPMLAMLQFFVQQSESIEEIQITFLLPGHTYMPADSMHSVIESNYRKKIIWAPSEWPTIITNSRFNPRPYEVYVRSFTDVMDWKNFQEKSPIDVGQIRKIRRAIFRKNNPDIMIYRDYDNSCSPLIVQVKRKTRNSSSQPPKPVYRSKIRISEKKKKDLINLCKKNITPSRYHEEYSSLPSSKGEVDFSDDEDYDDLED